MDGEHDAGNWVFVALQQARAGITGILNHQSRTRARSRPTVWQHVTGSQRLEILDKSLRKELPADS